MQPPPLHGINGRLRQHITKVGAAYANRISSPKKMVTDDDYLRGLMHSGRITQEQIEKVIDGYNHIPSSFAWMQKVEDKILDRADDVFLAKYGRDPTEDADFRLNGDYYKICRNLERDWHYYNADLEKLQWDYKRDNVQKDSQSAQVTKPEKVKCIQQEHHMTAVAFITAIYPIAGGLILFFFFQQNYSVDITLLSVFCFVCGIFLWMYLWSRIIPEFKCPVCSKGYNKGAFGSLPSMCKRCGVKFLW